MSVRGDYARADALERNLRTLDRARVEALEMMAHEAERQVANGFNNSWAPGGAPWRPLKIPEQRRRQGVPRDAVGRFAASRGVLPGRPLIRTRALYQSVQAAQVTASGFVIETTLPYAATHQYGRGKIPARPFLPLAGLPITWEQVFRSLAFEVIARHFR